MLGTVFVPVFISRSSEKLTGEEAIIVLVCYIVILFVGIKLIDWWYGRKPWS